MLGTPAVPVVDFGPDARALAQDLFDTMYEAKGRGLAAPQIGVLTRAFVMDLTWKEATGTPCAFFNPVILAEAPDRVSGPESCLSIPDRSFEVMRPAWIELEWTNADGAASRTRLDGIAAVCACHEIDHLDGVLITLSGRPL